MKQIHPLIATLSAASLLLCTITNADAHDVSNSRRSLRAQQQQHKPQHRRTSTNLCKSIIAVGGYEKRDLPKYNDKRRRTNEEEEQEEVVERRTNEQDGFYIGESKLIALPNSEEQPRLTQPPPSSLLTSIESDTTSDSDTSDFGSSSYNIATISYQDAMKRMNHHETDEEFVCELYNGHTLPINATEEQLVELRSLLNKGRLVSAVTSVEVEIETIADGSSEGVVGGGTIDGIEEDDMALLSEVTVALPEGSIRLINDDEVDVGDDNRRRRRLNMYEGKFISRVPSIICACLTVLHLFA